MQMCVDRLCVYPAYSDAQGKGDAQEELSQGLHRLLIGYVSTKRRSLYSTKGQADARAFIAADLCQEARRTVGRVDDLRR